MKKIIFIGVLAHLLVGCVSHAPSIPEGYEGPVAFVQDTEYRIDEGKADIFYLDAIDGRRISNSRHRSRMASLNQGNRLTTVLQENKVESGLRILTIVGRTEYAMPARSMVGTVYEVKGDVSIELKENAGYIIRGELAEDGSKVWIEDQSNGEVLEIIEVEGPSKLNFFQK